MSACRGSDSPPPGFSYLPYARLPGQSNSTLSFSVSNTKHLQISALSLTSSYESRAVHLEPRPSLPPVLRHLRRPHFSVMVYYVLFIFCLYSALPFDFKHSQLSTENKTNIVPSRCCPVLSFHIFL